jgi:hypothetical protein
VSALDRFDGYASAYWSCNDSPDEVCHPDPIEAIAEAYEQLDEDEIKTFTDKELEVYGYREFEKDSEEYVHFCTVVLSAEEVRELVELIEEQL